MNHDISLDIILPAPTELAEHELESISGGGTPLAIGATAALVIGLAELTEKGFDYIRAHTAPTPIVINDLMMVGDY
jgi:lactobin A/cerein 7B family class IIb bacteriocin